MHTYNMTVDT